MQYEGKCNFILQCFFNKYELSLHYSTQVASANTSVVPKPLHKKTEVFGHSKSKNEERLYGKKSTQILKDLLLATLAKITYTFFDQVHGNKD